MTEEPTRGSSEWIKAEQAKVTSKASAHAGINVGKWVGIGCGIPIAIVIVIVIITFAWPKTSPAPDAPSKYTQTWSSAYSKTTCDDWNGDMTNAQQFAAAADILTAARDKIDGATGMPPDSLINEFQAGITNVCVIPSLTLTDATYGLYKSEPRFHP